LSFRARWIPLLVILQSVLADLLMVPPCLVDQVKLRNLWSGMRARINILRQCSYILLTLFVKTY
jgi:hypothetical protein